VAAHFRVVAVHPNVELYGSDRMFHSAVLGLARRAEVLVRLPQEGPLADLLRDDGVQVEVSAFPVLRRVELTPRRVPGHASHTAIAAFRLAHWLRSVRADVVYVSTIVSPVVVFAARLARVRVVLHVHENDPAMGRLSHRLLIWPARLCAAVLVNSRSTGAWVRAGAPRVSERLTVVPNGVGIIDTGERAGLPEGLNVLLVGRLSEHKGQDVAVRALALLRDRGLDAHLTLLGDAFPGYEAFRSSLVRLGDELGISDRLHLVGFRDPKPYLYAVDVVIVPSRMESFGIAAVEALLAGRPTVVSRVQGLLEIVEDGITGLTVPAGDATALAEAVERLHHDKELAQCLASAGQERCRVLFSEEGYRTRVSDLVLEVARRALPRPAHRRAVHSAAGRSPPRVESDAPGVER